MKKRVILIMFVAVLFGFTVQAGMAEELDKRFALGGRAGFYLITDDDLPQGEITSNATVYGEANLTYFFVDYFSLELSGGYVKPDLDLELSSTGYVVEYGEIEQIPPSSVRARFIMDEGPKVRIGKIKFTGNKVYDDGDL